MIELIDLHREHRVGTNTVKALNGVSLRIGRGELITVMGPSGSGKSTLLNILGVLDLPTEGRYLLEDVDITELGDVELSRIRNKHFGFVFQSYNLFPELTAMENVMMPLVYAKVGKQARRGRAMELLGQVGMCHRVDHYPSQLSGGEQQRVAIARALVNKPSLLLADEPTGNLPSSQGDEILAIFKRLNETGTTIVIVTHDPKVGKLGSRMLTLRDGCIESTYR